MGATKTDLICQKTLHPWTIQASSSVVSALFMDIFWHSARIHGQHCHSRSSGLARFMWEYTDTAVLQSLSQNIVRVSFGAVLCGCVMYCVTCSCRPLRSEAAGWLSCLAFALAGCVTSAAVAAGQNDSGTRGREGGRRPTAYIPSRYV